MKHDERDDPAPAFDASTDSGVMRDPYPRLAKARREHAMLPGSLSEIFAMRLPEDALEPGIPRYVALGVDSAAQVLLDGETFSSRGYAKNIGLVIGHSILDMDEPEHHRHRALLQQAFSIKSMERWERDLVRPVVHELIDRFVARGHADLVRELTFPFPIRVIARMLGLPLEDLPQFHRWAVELISIVADPARGLAASQALRDCFTPLLAARRAIPGDDLITLLARAELDGERLDDDAIVSFLRLLLPAGAETTYRSSSNLLFGLLTQPDQLDALRRDRGLMRQAIEEGLRWECPLTGIYRNATRDTEVAGVRVPAGALVAVSLGSANRDETRWSRPHEFDIFREPKPHMAFAYGPHTCLGMHLARMETRVVVDAVLDRLPELRLDPAAEDVHVSGLGFRAPERLPVLFGT